MEAYPKIKNIYQIGGNKKYLLGEYSFPELEYLQDMPWVFTEKVDGTNIRLIFQNGRLSVFDRAGNGEPPASVIDYMKEAVYPNIDLFRETLKNDACFYGEGYGPKIQYGGHLYGDKVKFVLFDIKIGRWWLRREDVEGLAKILHLDVVPIIGKGKLKDGVEMVVNHTSYWGNFPSEGFVAKPEVDLLTRSGERIIAKIKRKYL